MKKQLNLAILTFLFCSCSYAQDMGFRTTDIGGEYQWYPHGSIYNLHVAFNAKLNHSIQLRLGYNNVPAYDAGDHTEFGKGWGGGLGYRYYFKPFPYKFFIGARADVWARQVGGKWSCERCEQKVIRLHDDGGNRHRVLGLRSASSGP